MTLDEMAEAIKNMPSPTREEIKQFWIDFNKQYAERQKYFEQQRKDMIMSYEDYHKPFDM